MDYLRKKYRIKTILNKLFFGLIVLSIFSCKTYYNTEKIYFESDKDIIKFSSNLNINMPTIIKLKGFINYNNKKYNINGSIKIENENNYQIFLNSRTLGIEILRIDFYKDSLTLIDRINKSYYNGITSDYLKIDSNIVLSNNDLLCAFLGRCFSGINYKNDSSNNLKFNYRNSVLQGYIYLNNFGYINKTIISINNIPKIEVSYNNYSKKYRLPTNISGYFLRRNENVRFIFNYLSVSKLKDNLKRFKVPKSYNII